MIPIRFFDLGFPVDFSGTLRDLADTIPQYIGGVVGSERMILGQVGGTEPLTDVGLWLDGDIWKYFNATKSRYVPFDIGIATPSLANAAPTFTVTLIANPSANRIIQAPDKQGTVALLEDVFEPRTTVDLTGLAPTIDWSKSFVFRCRMPGGGDVAFTMINSLPSQEIYVVVINSDSSKVVWPSAINWETILAPVQTIAAVADDIHSDGGTFNGTAVIYSVGAQFVLSDVGKTIKENTSSPLAIPAATTIFSVAADGTSCTMSANATSTQANLVFNIVGRSVQPRTDLYRFKNVGGTVYGHQISNYSGVAQAIIQNAAPLAPIFNPGAGHYTNNSGTLSTTIIADDRANRIIYTLDGSTPTLVYGTVITSRVNGIVTGTIVITGATPTNNITVKAIAVSADDGVSPVTTGAFFNDYTGAVVVPDPVASVAAGTYTTFPTTMPVAITFYSPGTRFRYTTDGTTPSASVGTLVATNNFTIQIPQGTTTLKFIAIDAGTNVSNVISRTYTNTYSGVPNPTTTLAAGTYTTFPGNLLVPFNVASPGVRMIVTGDGSTPTLAHGQNIFAQSGSVAVPQGATETIKIIGVDASNNISAVVTKGPYVNHYSAPPPPTVANPTLTPSGGLIPLQVAIKCVSPAVKTRYTTDGSAPTLTNGTLINSTNGLTAVITKNTTLKAIAITSDNRISGITTGIYDSGN